MGIKLSVAIPVYNGAMTIGHTLDSFILQIDSRMEIVVSDNASTDETREIVEKYRLRYPSIKYFRNEKNLGFDLNLNLAVQRSSGEYVWILGDDDEIANGGIKAVQSVIDSYGDVASIFVNYGLYERVSGKCCVERSLNIQSDIYCEDSDKFLNVVTTFPNFLSSNIVRRSLWLSVDSTKYIGTHWLQYGMLMSITPGHSAYCIATPYVLNKGIEFDGPNEFNKGGVAVGVLLNLVDILNSLPTVHYSESSVDKARAEAYKFLPRKILSSRRNGLTLTRKLFSRLYAAFGDRISFWVRDIPLLLLPKVVHLYIWKLYKLPLVNSMYWKIASKPSGESRTDNS